MKITTLCTALLILATAKAQVGRGAFKATVCDKSTGEALPFVNVALLSEDMLVTGGQTGMDGTIHITAVAPGNYRVVMSYLGYEKLVFENVMISAERDTRLLPAQTRMTIAAHVLPEVVIVEAVVPVTETIFCTNARKWVCGFQEQIPVFRDVDSNTVGTAPAPPEKPTWSIYPNPAHNAVQLECSHPIGELVVFDMKGMTVQALNIPQNSRVIDMQHLGPGTYFLRFRDGAEWVNARVLIVD